MEQTVGELEVYVVAANDFLTPVVGRIAQVLMQYGVVGSDAEYVYASLPGVQRIDDHCYCLATGSVQSINQVEVVIMHPFESFPLTFRTHSLQLSTAFPEPHLLLSQPPSPYPK